VSLPATSISVLMGGPSAEHEVSLVSGRAIVAALREREHDVGGWLIDLQARWWRLPPSALDPHLPAKAYRSPDELGATGPLRAAAALDELASRDPQPVVFPAIHGAFGEDGQLQALLESVGLTYCGAGPAASAVGMDKTLFKRICSALELPILPWTEIRAADHAVDPDAIMDELRGFAARLSDPRLVIKPARQGSSIGISIVHEVGPAALTPALEDAFRYDDLVLAEPYLEHPRELETSVLGNSRADIVAYGPGEIVPGREFYDYIAKYRSDTSRTFDLADIEPALAVDIRAAAIEVYLAIGVTGFARVDMLLSADGIPYISEINTIPGFTPISLFPRMTAQGGHDFADTCERVVELAIERAALRPRRVLSPDDLP
jgi:D-alanine-D-alanine ligase